MENNKCKNCGGMYEYSPADNALKCVKCGSIKKIRTVFNIPIHAYLTSEDRFDNTWAKEIRHVKCKSCGAEVVFNKYEIINKCSYCGNTALDNVKENASISPDAIIPFQFDKKQAIKYFQEGLKKKYFIPNILKKKMPDVNLSSNYIGAYIFSGKATVKYSGVLEYETTSTNFKGERKTEYHNKYVDGSLIHSFKNRIYECSSNLTQEELNYIMPYDLINMNAYKSDYLLGASAEYSDKSVKTANEDLQNDLKNEIKKLILRKYSCDRIKRLDLNIEFNEKNYVYALFPIYIFNYKYKEKQYKTVMNGQTGELGGNVPRSNVKITFFVLFIMLIIGSIFGVIFI